MVGKELTGVAQGGQPSFAQIAPGGSVNWNSGATTVTQTATTQGAIDGQITQSQFNSRRQIRILVSEINTRFGTTDGQYIVGLPVVGNGKLQSGTIITRLSGTYGSGANQYFRYDLSLQATSNITVGETVSIRKEFNDAPTSNLYFQKASWESSGATQGTSVAASDTRFPANTSVVSVQLETFAGTEYYDVQFSQSSDNSTITKGTTTVTFDFTQPPYAQPGETIFGFVARPGERSTLDLSFIKELTNTTLGGRGTFPNGPDVLALNVYKTSGQAVNGEIILRWSEAQA